MDIIYIVVNKKERVTSELLQNYEFEKLLESRLHSIAKGDKLALDSEDLKNKYKNYNTKDLVKAEIMEKKTPLKIVRTIKEYTKNGKFYRKIEIWKLDELIIPMESV